MAVRVLGEPTGVVTNPDGTFVLSGIPVGGTLHLTDDDGAIDATFTGTDTLAGTPTSYAVTGTRSYTTTVTRPDHRSHTVQCRATDAGRAPNQAGGGDFIERLRCADHATIVLRVSDISPILNGGVFAGWNRTVTAVVN